MKPKHYYNYSVLTVQKHWMYSDIYKRGKSTIRRLKKKNKVANQNGTIDEQCKNTVEKRAQINDWEKIKIKNKKSDEQYILNKSKVL